MKRVAKRKNDTRDYQKQRLYDFEADYIKERGCAPVAFDRAQLLVDFVWQDQGLLYPPKVVPMNPRDTHGGKANRFEVDLHTTTTTRIILHELAHSMTCDVDGSNNGHGPDYVGVYLKLLEKYMAIPFTESLYVAQEVYKLDVNPVALPWCR